MKSPKINVFALVSLVSPFLAAGWRAHGASISPELVSVYKRMVAYEDGFPEPKSPNENRQSRLFEALGYDYQNEELDYGLREKFAHLLPDIHSKDPETIKKRQEMVYSLQRLYGATTYSIVLMLPDQTSKSAATEERNYIRRNPSLRLTKMAKFWMLPDRRSH
jgi:hypothetical protein